MIRIASVAVVLGAISTPFAGFTTIESMLGKYLVARVEAGPMPSLICYACAGCGGDKHDLVWTTPPPGSATYEGPNHSCDGGHSCSAHTECNEFASDQLRGQLWAALEKYEARLQLGAILEAFPQVHYDAERNGFHLMECNQITGFLPASPFQIAALE